MLLRVLAFLLMMLPALGQYFNGDGGPGWITTLLLGATALGMLLAIAVG
jgi:hypothetical protein